MLGFMMKPVESYLCESYRNCCEDPLIAADTDFTCTTCVIPTTRTAPGSPALTLSCHSLRSLRTQVARGQLVVAPGRPQRSVQGGLLRVGVRGEEFQRRSGAGRGSGRLQPSRGRRRGLRQGHVPGRVRRTPPPANLTHAPPPRNLTVPSARRYCASGVTGYEDFLLLVLSAFRRSFNVIGAVFFFLMIVRSARRAWIGI